jgi:hypothetical protein
MKEMNITQIERDELMLYSDLIMGSNRAYTNLQTHSLYDLYNRIYGENKRPNGCGACLRSTLSHLRKALMSITDKK